MKNRSAYNDPVCYVLFAIVCVKMCNVYAWQSSNNNKTTTIFYSTIFDRLRVLIPFVKIHTFSVARFSTLSPYLFCVACGESTIHLNLNTMCLRLHMPKRRFDVRFREIPRTDFNLCARYATINGSWLLCVCVKKLIKSKFEQTTVGSNVSVKVYSPFVGRHGTSKKVMFHFCHCNYNICLSIGTTRASM